MNKININLLNDIINNKLNNDLNKDFYTNLKSKFPVKVINFINGLYDENIKIVKINTEYPSGYYYIYILDNKLKVLGVNNHNSKISNEEQENFMYKFLKNINFNNYYINDNKIINFYDFFISLENFRDINNNIINKLIKDNSNSYELKKICGFGFCPSNKPFRTKFINMANKHKNKLFYYNTPVYNKNNPKILSWIEIKNKFKYIIDLPGHTYSTKLYTLLFCKRLIFLVGEKREYMFNWEHQLKPYIHFIPIKEDYSDLIQKYNWAENNQNKVKEIIKNAYDFGMKEMNNNKLKNILIDNIFTQKNLNI
jgi:hypothetical protein